MSTFQAAKILVPKEDYLNKWAVIACDQYTSQPEYWDHVKKFAGDAPSTLNLILPEAQIQPNNEQRVQGIHKYMADYRAQDILREYPQSFVYTERTLVNGMIRRGLVGVIDLEQYEYTDKNSAHIRATEKTVMERIPVRKAIREGSPLDMSHVILFADDPKDTILGSLESRKNQMPKLYDFDLMEDGGHAAGWLVQNEDARALETVIAQYEKYMLQDKGENNPLAYVVGDGNHSLASAKACYSKVRDDSTAEELSDHPLRYALVELENIHDKSQEFEPIHRIVSIDDPKLLLDSLQDSCGAAQGYPVQWYAGNEKGILYLDETKGKSAISILQKFLDSYLEDLGKQLDYIHGEEVVKDLSKAEHKLGFILPQVPKADFFQSILVDGVLPRKTFSVGHAQEKRYYLETRDLI